ncbi:hypothetical protein GASC598B02_006380, partial [Gilliamella apicola SCGC AB-598-B02]
MPELKHNAPRSVGYDVANEMAT